ncbi:MAG: helix-hairpin-helix domain-containing protein, partial [Acidobacteriota bacterium]|nr:helix-hairpin-helix domain-containing protein [Acidobacteriota bacterium]
MDLDPTLLQKIAKESGASPKQVGSTLGLLEKRSAIPFIARYRKEVTGNLDESRIRRIAEGHGRHRALLKRRRVILARIEDQGKLTEELKDRILACSDKSRLEDLYSPFKRKESKEASAAGEKGLEPLAKKIWEQETGEFSVDAAAQEFLSEEKAVATAEEAIEGALAIVAGWVADDAAIRGGLRKLMASDGMLVSKVVEGREGEKSRYEGFYDFREEISRIPFHRMTVLRRGAREGILTLEIELDDQKALQSIKDKRIRQTDSPCIPHLERAIRNAWIHSLKPLLQAEVESNLKEKSDNEALKLFQANLANLLLAPPVGSVPVIGIDPGARPACRIAVIDGNGGYREHATFAPGLPRRNSDRAEAILYRLIQRHGAHAIAIGNGVGSRETERFVKSFLTKYHSGHSFDLTLVRGKAARSESPSRKKEKVNGQTASEPSAPGEDSRPPITEAVEKPDPPREDSLSASDGKNPGAVSAPVPQKGKAAVDAGSVPADSLSEEDSAATASPLARETVRDDESSHQTGETVSSKPADTGTPLPPKAAAAQAHPASQDAEPSPRQPIFSAIVHKGGTAAYASSEAARKEFPKLDLGVRGAISIARRMQDPLAELAKIRPKAIVAGSGPHEVDPNRLNRKLNGTVESCINQVGVDVNTAPVEMLAHIAGLNYSLAQSIVEYRRQHGHFSSRSQLMEVPGLTDTIFEQAAGFLRVPESRQPMDRTAIHPECYGLVEEMAESVQASVAELMESPEKLKALDLEKLSNDRFGLPTLQDIRREL